MGDLPENEFLFHATAIYATGGMLLSGDDLTAISPGRMALLRRLSPPTGTAARFADDSFRVGEVVLADQRVFCLLNWSESPQSLSFTLPGPHRIREVWTDADLGGTPPVSSRRSCPAARAGPSAALPRAEAVADRVVG